MFVVIGIVVIIIGLVSVISPKSVFIISESWKFEEKTEPSDTYIYNVKFGGYITIVVGVIFIIMQFFQ